MASRHSVEQQREAQAGVADQAKRDLSGFFGSLRLDRPEAARDALLTFVPALTDRYGDVSATLAADWFDQLRGEAGAAGRFVAPMAPNVDPAAPVGTVRRVAGELFTDQPVNALPGMLLALSRYVLQPGRMTIVNAAHADPARPRWARVPGGAEPCAFCEVMASRGFVYRSAETAGDATEYHGDCHCSVVPDWSDHPALKGYDPGGLYAKYRDAADLADSGSLGDVLARFRELHGVA